MNAIEELNVFFEIPDATVNILLDDILKNNNISNKIIVSDNVYTDTTIDEWFNKRPTTIGGMKIINKIIKTPINDKELLIQRQKSNYELLNYQQEILKNNEKDLLWIMTLKDEIDDDLAINLLYPSTYLINYMNYSSYLLDIYHFYKIILLPMTSLIYPLSIIYTPYYYINRYLHIDMSFVKYMGIIYEFLKILFKLSGNIKTDLTKIITIFIYLSIYIYSIYQTFYISYIIYKTREKLFNKLIGLVDFIKTSITIIKQSNNIWKSFFLYSNSITEEEINNSINNLSLLDNNLSTVYKLWKNDNYKYDIINLLKIIYTIDAIDVICKLKNTNNWCLPTYNSGTVSR